MENTTTELKTATGAIGAKHLMDQPLSGAATRRLSPDLMLSDIDSRIVKVRPMATPVDQISRMASARKCKSMIADYYQVDTLPTEATVTATVARSRENATLPVKVDNPAIFSVSETVLATGCSTDSGAEECVFYVTAVGNNSVTLKAIGRDKETFVFPDIAIGSKLVRMGRAAAELDVQTPQAQAVPVKMSNYCQIFKAQVEQGHIMAESAKEVGWTLTEQEETAVIDMRQGMEKSFLFGRGCRFDKGPGYGEVFMTKGIWHQTDNDFTYTRGTISADCLVDLSRRAFTGCGASSKKVLLAGSGLISALAKMNSVKALGATQTTTRWGIDFTEIHTNFGRLFVVLCETFDTCGHADDGMIVDPEYLQKYTHLPFNTQPIDMSKSGQRNTQVTVLTEASCLVLRYPTAHVRIIAVEPPATDAGDGDDDEFAGE